MAIFALLLKLCLSYNILKAKREVKARTQTDVCTPKFIAALEATPVSTDRRTDKQNVVYMYNGTLALKRKKVLTHAMT